MSDEKTQFVEIGQLRIGMFVHLDLGWMDHPFPFGSFRIKSQDQIDQIRSLGLERVRISSREGDLPISPGESANASSESAEDTAEASTGEVVAISAELIARSEYLAALSEQQASLERCERSFREAAKNYRQVVQSVISQPRRAKEEADRAVESMLHEMVNSGETAIRLLSEKAGEENALHALNVTVLSLLLGRSCGLDENALRQVGMAALLHDIGKLELPHRLRWPDMKLSTVERRLYEEHVPKGLELAERMGLGGVERLIIEQHHESDDGSGFPNGLPGSAISVGSRIVALVNQYDNLCNPGNLVQALTPHDALALIFAKMRKRFDVTTLSTFIRMMGVYPPGSIVQLTDDRYALSVSVNASRPLKPCVMVYDETIPPDEALILDLETAPDIGVRRSLKQIQLPKPVLEYLSPRKRICYFFEKPIVRSDSVVADV